MSYVKLECDILNSTLWFQRTAREAFITSLLMAVPYELRESAPQIAVDSLEPTGWVVPAGWYGFVASSAIGILRRAGIEDYDAGMAALMLLGSPEKESRSQDFDGRRMVRIDGGYLILNYIKYRLRDGSSAARSRRWRDRQKLLASMSQTSHVSRVGERVTPLQNVSQRRDVTFTDTIAEVQVQGRCAPSSATPTDVLSTPTETASQEPELQEPPQEPETHEDQELPGDDQATEVQGEPKKTPTETRFERFWMVYPRKTGKKAAFRVWERLKVSDTMTDLIIAAVERQKSWSTWLKNNGEFIPHPATWLHQGRWEDEPPPPGRGGPPGSAAPAFQSHSPRTAGNAEATRRFIERIKTGGGGKP